MMHYYGTGELLELKGIFTKRMLERLNIPFEKVTKHGILFLFSSEVELYEAPFPYNNVTVFHEFWNAFTFDPTVPTYYFSEDEIKKYKLTPIGKDEFPAIICRWSIRKPPNEKIIETSTISFKYNRKNEEKYRLRFLMDPDFDPIIWEVRKETQGKLF